MIEPSDKKQVSEITVVVKDYEKRLRAKFLIYESYTVNSDDPIIGMCVAKTIESFQGEPDSVSIKISMVL